MTQTKREKDKLGQARDHILTLLERGELAAGAKLPGARELAARLNISFVKVQAAVESLVRDGVLATASRQGTYVQPGWADRLLQENFVAFSSVRRLPWLPGALAILNAELPRLRYAPAFRTGVCELRTTLTVQRDQAHYLDLEPLLAECYPDRSVFFAAPFAAFRPQGRLVGIPFIFSPRVIYYQPHWLARAGVPEPQGGWAWEDFLNLIRRLKRVLPPDRIFNWDPQSFHWINFVMRSGGGLINPHAEDPILLDHPATRRGLNYFAQLGAELGRPELDGGRYHDLFAAGETALLMGPRELQCTLLAAGGNDEWRAAPLPHLPGGADLTTQATDLICVRKECTDLELARDFIRIMLSPRMQDYIAEQRYGIPIRQTSALRSFHFDDPRDALFLGEMAKVSAAYNLDSPELAGLVIDGIDQALREGRDLDLALTELAGAIRLLCKIRRAGCA